MRRFILTGAPGAGKTVILRHLERDGFSVVEEAASDVIALQRAETGSGHDPTPAFVDAVARLQMDRMERASAWPDALQFHDRSLVCTLALAEFLGFSPSATLRDALARVAAEKTYQEDVFFIENLGFIENTAARRISFEAALAFEAVHRNVYRRLGYRLVTIAPGSPAQRTATIRALASAKP